MATEKSILITGGTGALGGAVVEAAIVGGHSASVVYIVPAEWEKLRERVGNTDRLLGLEGDVLSADFMANAVQEIIERFGRLDALVHLVGGYRYAPLDETPPDLWNRIINLNLTSAYTTAHAALPALSERGGSMAFVGAQAAITAPPGQVAYNASKAGVLSFMQSLAHELRPKGIRVNSIVPDIIDTPANRASMPKSNPDRWLQPSQVADALMYLVSDEASGVTGAAVTLQRA